MSIVNFFNAKAKVFTVFVFSLVAVGLLAASVYLFATILNFPNGLLLGIIMMAVAIPFHIIGKRSKWTYLVSFLLNSVANGLSVSAYYTEKNIVPSVYDIIIGIIPAVCILILVYLMLQIFGKTKKITITVACILNAFLTILFVAFWIINKGALFSFGFFASLVSLFYLGVFGITVNHDKRSVLRDISFGSFGAFVIATVVVLFVLSEGDILDGAEILEIFSGNGKNKKKK